MPIILSRSLSDSVKVTFPGSSKVHGFGLQGFQSDSLSRNLNQLVIISNLLLRFISNQVRSEHDFALSENWQTVNRSKNNNKEFVRELFAERLRTDVVQKFFCFSCLTFKRFSSNI